MELDNDTIQLLCVGVILAYCVGWIVVRIKRRKAGRSCCDRDKGHDCKKDASGTCHCTDDACRDCPLYRGKKK
ncbi:MAG: hypothetical protein LIO90_11525 [Bacteroidales bacterium]|nr:hypothetical protein [Bacteroidales bacterium]